MKTGHALRGAFKAVCNFNQSIYDWYDRQSFKLYYLMMCQDTDEIAHVLPLSDSMAERTAHVLQASRSSLFTTAATQAAAGDHAKPGYGNVWAGFMTHADKSLRPAMDIALRTGINTPLRVVILGAVSLLLFDYLAGGHLRDSVTQMIASVNTESGKAKALPVHERAGEYHEKPAPKDWTMLYARPSVF